jgi:hypothetical protein
MAAQVWARDQAREPLRLSGIRSCQWLGENAWKGLLESTQASDVHDRLDQVVVPSLTKKADLPRKSVQQESLLAEEPFVD